MNWCVSRPDHESAPSMPSWFGARCSDRRVSTALRRVLTKICERVRGCRADGSVSTRSSTCSRSRSRYAHPRRTPTSSFLPETAALCGPKRCALFDRDRLRASSILARDFSALTKEPGRAPCAPCFSTICERSPLARREANRGSGGPSGRHSGDLRYRWHA